METIISLLTNLISDRLSGHNKDVAGKPISDEMLKKLLRLAKQHDLTALIGLELIEQHLILQDHTKACLQDSLCEAVCYYEKMNFAFCRLCQQLEKGQIPFIPLKGAVIRDHYPKPWMRGSGDIDILVPEAYLEKAVSLLLFEGCKQIGKKRFHDVPLLTPEGILLELHFQLQENIPSMDPVLDRVWEFSEPIPGKKYQHRVVEPYLLFYLLAHMAYHFINGGCGIRSFIDLWLLQKGSHYDRKLLESLCAEAKLDLFYTNVNHLICVWFEGKLHTPTSRLLEQMVVKGGTFGTEDNRILIEQAQIGSKKKHTIYRIWKPYEELKKQFPVLQQKPWLAPSYQLIRWVRVFSRDRFGLVTKELQIGQHHPDEQIDDTKKLLKNIGLNI